MSIPVRIVLVDTSHPGNIGAAARAMKTMGLTELVLVRPRHFPSDEATARASGANDVLDAARVVDTLTDAVADCGFVVGASARLRSLSWPVADPRACAERLWQAAGAAPAAIMFGAEQSGLTNEDLARCQLLAHIPTNPDYGSLNVAMAVQVLCYELKMAEPQRVPVGTAPRDAPPASAAELEGFFEHLEALLSEAGFLHPDHPRQLRLRLRRLFHRAELDRNEINILRGMLASLEARGGTRGSMQ